MKDRAIEERFSDLGEILKSSDLPQWRSVYFVEDFYLDPSSKQMIERDSLYSIAEYSDRFEILLSQGHGWLNMSGLGLLDNDLIVAIERPDVRSPSFECGAPTTSVNFSGPMNCVEEKNYNLSTFIGIKE